MSATSWDSSLLWRVEKSPVSVTPVFGCHDTKTLHFLLSSQATYVRPKSCYLPSWLTPQYSDASFLVSRFYSRTNSFLKIVPEPKQLECNQQKVVTVLYSLNSEAYEDDSNVKFFYLVSLRVSGFLESCSIVRLLSPAQLRKQASVTPWWPE